MNLLKKLFYKPLSTDLTVTSSNGFHLRPVAKFVSLAKQYTAEITLHFDGTTVNAKSVNSILTLSLEQKDSFRLIAQGKDANKALKDLEVLFNTLMQDDKEVEAISKEKNIYTSEAVDANAIYQGIVIAPLYTYQEEVIHHENHGFYRAIF